MPYIESALEVPSGDEEAQKTDWEEEKFNDKNTSSDENYNSFVPHPNVNLKRNSKLKKSKDFVPHPNVRLNRSKEFRDWESEKILMKKSGHDDERETVSMPVTKQEIECQTKCTCKHEIDPDIIVNCVSFGDCSICQNAKKVLKKSSKISFMSETCENKDISIFSSECQKCHDLFKDAPHMPICKSQVKCRDCEKFKNQIRKKIVDNESAEELMSIGCSSFADSCMSLDQCRDCQIAREVKKQQKLAIKVTHKNCLDDFCIPCEFLNVLKF
jgi:hypothetical protein